MTTMSRQPQADSTTEKPLPAAKPFLKWTGGKQWLAFVIGDALSVHSRRHYIEPFLGGGAIFFALKPKSALLTDSNPELIVTYEAVRDDVELVISKLSKLENNKETYQRLRSSAPTSSVGRAVRFIYLNKTAFNGIYRVNKQGVFNVPYAYRRETTICQANKLRAASKALSGVSLRVDDFDSSLRTAERGDFVYLDPPYVTMHNNNGFLKYNTRLFSWDDQLKLATTAERLRKKGVRVMVSNAAHDSVKALYPNFNVLELKRNSLIGGGAMYRGAVTEALLTSFPFTT